MNWIECYYQTPDGGNEKICYFSTIGKIIYVIYGNFLDKKAAWLLNQMKTNLMELTTEQQLEHPEKLTLYNISQDFQKKAQFLLEEYVKT